MVTHSFQSAIPDDPAATAAGELTPTRWNAGHATSELTTSKVLVPDGAGGVEWVSYLALGADPPATGAVRLTPDTYIVSKRNGNDIALIGFDSLLDNQMVINPDGIGETVIRTNVDIGTNTMQAGSHRLTHGGAFQESVDPVDAQYNQDVANKPLFTANIRIIPQSVIQLLNNAQTAYQTFVGLDASDVLVLMMTGIPTSPVGLATGQVYSNAGVLMVA